MSSDLNKVDQELQALRQKIRHWQHLYYVKGQPAVSDSEFDRHFDRLLALESEYPDLASEDSPSSRVGSDLVAELPEVAHSIPVLSLDKAYSLDEIRNWVVKTGRLSISGLSFCAEEKIDGVSIVLYYVKGVLKRGVTRGNGLKGNDITANIRTIKTVPLRLSQPWTLAVRGEVYLPLSRFESLNQQLDGLYANPRNLTAGTLRRVRSGDVARIPLKMFAYEGFFSADHEPEAVDVPATQQQMFELLDELGFQVNPRQFFFTADELSILEAFIARCTGERKDLDYEIDGLVIKVNELAARDPLGYTGHHPRWAIAYKFESPQAVTTVLDIDVQIGRTGRITPVARVQPVSIGGSTVSNATLHNQDYINMLELAIGDQVAISRRGDVIPAVERVLEKNPDGASVWQMPESCPSCAAKLVIRGAHLFCPNRSCQKQLLGRLYFFVGRDQMDIEGCGPETINLLVRKNLVSNIADLYDFNPELLIPEPGFGEKKAALLARGLADSKTRPYARVLAALGIPELGPRMCEILIDAGIRDIDSLLQIAERQDADQLSAIHGVGEKTAATIIEELQNPEVRILIERLRQSGLQFAAGELEASDLPQIFAGQIWCVTGSFAEFNPRSLAVEEIKKRGGRAVSAVSGSTTHLLAGSGAGSKLQKAEAQKIAIVSEDQFLALLAGE